MCGRNLARIPDFWRKLGCQVGRERDQLVEVRRPPSPPPAHNRQPANGGKDAQVIRDDETDEIYLVMELMAKALAKGKKLKRDTARQHMRSEPPPCAALSIRRSFSQQRTRRL